MTDRETQSELAVMLRKECGLTQAEAGAMIGRTPEAVANWEHGRCKLPQYAVNQYQLRIATLRSTTRRAKR